MSQTKERAFRILDAFFKQEIKLEQEEVLRLHSVIDALVSEHADIFLSEEINRLKYYKFLLKNHLVRCGVNTSEYEKQRSRGIVLEALSDLYFIFLGKGMKEIPIS